MTGSTTVKPTVELTKKQEAELQAMELRMLRLAMVVTGWIGIELNMSRE